MDSVLPVPQFVRDKLWSCFDKYVKTKDQEVPFLMAELQELRNQALSEFEMEECFKTEDFSQFSFELRTLRKKIYEENWVKGYNDHELSLTSKGTSTR